MQVHPCRNCLDKIFRSGNQVSNSTLADDDDDVSVVDDHGTGEMSTFKHVSLTVAIVLGGFSIAYFVDNLQMGEPSHRAANLTKTQLRDSAFLRRLHRVDDSFVYPTWPVLLEVDEG